jgi:hypothetical protein
MIEVHKATQKPTAVLDKSFFQEICKLVLPSRNEIWKTLFQKYQPVIPFILLEEIVVNAVNPGGIPKEQIETMVSDIRQLRACWMDDVLEYSFRELILRQQIAKLIAPPDHIQKMFLALDINDPEARKWADERKRDGKTVAQRWKNLQQTIAPSGFHIVGSDKEFLQSVVLPEFLKILKNPAAKKEYLESVLGEKFRQRHPNSLKDIETAFDEYTEKNYELFPVTRICLVLRLVYLLAPVVRIQPSSNTTAAAILSSRTNRQINNSADEQYVASAQLCDRLITRDRGMKNVAEIFRNVGLWPGQTIFFDSQTTLISQALSIF